MPLSTADIPKGFVRFYPTEGAFVPLMARWGHATGKGAIWVPNSALTFRSFDCDPAIVWCIPAPAGA